MKINFKKLEAQSSFEGEKKIFDITQDLGNQMMYNGSILLDIGFEDLAKEIYYSKEEIEIPEHYVPAIIKVMQESSFIAAVKREVIKRLTPEKK